MTITPSSQISIQVKHYTQSSTSFTSQPIEIILPHSAEESIIDDQNDDEGSGSNWLNYVVIIFGILLIITLPLLYRFSCGNKRELKKLSN